MWRRSSARILGAFSRALPADASVQACAAADAQLLPSLLPFTRGFGTNFWDVTTPQRQDLYIELQGIREMLPNRSPFTPHFTPHGIMLMPNSNSMRLAAVPAQQQAVADEAEQHEESGLWADSVKRKRKLKMKRHKLKKRRKLTRHQQ